MDAKSLVAVLFVSCLFFSVCLQPAASQGLRWGRDFEEEHSRMKPAKADYLRERLYRKRFENSAKKGETIKAYDQT